MHDLGIVHRDLKLENIIMAQTDRGIVAKIADLGLARFITSEPDKGPIVGSLGYMAPEVI